MITNTRSHSKILDNCFIVGQDKVQDVFHTSLSTASLTIRWRPCFSRNSNGFLAGEKGADVIELLLKIRNVEIPCEYGVITTDSLAISSREASSSSKFPTFSFG